MVVQSIQSKKGFHVPVLYVVHIPRVNNLQTDFLSGQHLDVGKVSLGYTYAFKMLGVILVQ